MTTDHDSASDSLARASGEAALVDHHPETGGPRMVGPAPDPLSDVLRGIRLTGALYFVWDVAWPYVTPVPDGRTFAADILPGAQQAISYHIVTEGSAWGGLVGGEPMRLDTGDILLVPQGAPYVMSDAAETCRRAATDLDGSLAFFRQMAAGQLPFVVEQGSGRQRTRVICGFLGCDLHPFNPVLSALPPIVRLPDHPGREPLRRLVELTLAEEREPRPGSRCVLLRLSELMFVAVLRRCLLELEAPRGSWVAGLADPVTARALLLLHRRPGEPWTLEGLAREVAVSRSHLADRFTLLVGQPPMQYLTRWRMQLAARMLADEPTKVASIATMVGYGSESAFSRAFKRCVGVSPAQWRDGKRPLGDSGRP